MQAPDARVFLLLQGPHGPFFWKLGKMLQAAGAHVWRIGFNAGDRAFWPSSETFIPFVAPQEQWLDTFTTTLKEKGVTDLVLYGDTRPIHAAAIEYAKAQGVMVHVFEEGYIRPFWITYERGGSNGNSELMRLSVDDMRKALEHADPDTVEAPAHWGDMRQHIFYGALYHWFVMFRNKTYTNFQRHRELSVFKEFSLYFKRLVLMPHHFALRAYSTRRIKNGGYPYHIALLQLEHDTSFQMHSPYETMPDFIEQIVTGFAAGAPRHHHLVFKAHPLETDRRNLNRDVQRMAAQHGLEGRVHFVRGGKLAELLNFARSAVTVNSTAGQQVLSRGLPLKVFGSAVFDKPEFVSSQPLAEFFEQAQRPNKRAYADYRQFLLETSQVPGGYYSAAGRRQLLRLVVDMMLSPDEPYDALRLGKSPPRLPSPPSR
jgi:capsular polysaccharide export protein